MPTWLVALNTRQIKTGAPSRSERVGDNQLLRIEEELAVLRSTWIAGFNIKK